MLAINTECRYRLTGREYTYGEYSAIRHNDVVYLRRGPSAWVVVHLVHGELQFDALSIYDQVPYIEDYVHDFLFTFFGI